MDEGSIVFDVGVDGEVCDAVWLGINHLIVMVTLREFLETGREVVEAVKSDKVEVIKGRREVGGRSAQHILEI